jgi:hypothetical protein
MSFVFKNDEFLADMIDLFLSISEISNHYYHIKNQTNDMYEEAGEYYLKISRDLQNRIDNGNFVSKEEVETTLADLYIAKEVVSSIDIDHAGEVGASVRRFINNIERMKPHQ